MSGFRRVRGGDAVASFSVEEASMLADLARQVSTLIAGRADTAHDPALERLLPDAYRDNAEHADEFRRFTEEHLADGKMRNATAIADALSAPSARGKVEVRLDATAAGAWMRSLTDLRLTLAARVGIVDESMPSPRDDSEEMLLAIYEWLGYQLETLIRAIDR